MDTPFCKQVANGGRNKHPATLLRELQTATAQLERIVVLRTRIERIQARDHKREWVQDRRARTRHLIELGGLVQKAGLVELTDDDRATLLGAFLELASQLRNGDDQDTTPADLVARWRRRGLRVFEAEREVATVQEGQEERNATLLTSVAAGIRDGTIKLPK